MEARQGTTTDNNKQQQATTGNGKQRQATTSNDRQRQATTGNGKQRQAMTGNGRQWPTSVSNDREQGTTTDTALPVPLLPAFRHGGPVPDVPQHGNVRQLLQVLDAVGFQGDVPVPDFYSGQAGNGGLTG